MSKKIVFNANNSIKEAKDIFVGIGGVKRRIIKVLTSVNDTIKVIYEYNGTPTRKGYLFIDYYGKKLYLTENFVDYEEIFAVSNNNETLCNLISVGNSIYLYSYLSTLTSGKLYVFDASLGTPTEHELSRTLPTGTSSISFYVRSGVIFHNNKFYTTGFSKVAYSGSTGSKVNGFILVSDDGYNFVSHKVPGLYTANSNYSLTIGESANFGFLTGSDFDFIIIQHCPFNSSQSVYGGRIAYIKVSDIDGVGGDVPNYKSYTTGLTINDIYRRCFKLSDNEILLGSNNLWSKSITYDSVNDSFTLTNIGYSSSPTQYQTVQYLNNKSYRTSTSNKPVYISVGTSNTTVNLTGNYASSIVDKDGNILIFDSGYRMYKLDSTDSLTNLGTVLYIPRISYDDNCKTYLYLSGE